ncbi:MAG: hypothetical protein EXQ64_04755 [Ilumatobacteraceae bacterium]|nr:hypothetical protein [Ilumatobacteraceae bacterium]
MSEIGIRQLRQSLAAAVRRAKTGERVVITIDGEAVAQIGPVESLSHGITLTELIARGLVIAPRRRIEHIAIDPVVLYAGVRIDRALQEIRQ